MLEIKKLDYYCGIDAGSTYCKIIIIDTNLKILHSNLSKIKGDPEETAGILFKEAIKNLKIKKKKIKTSITGQNGKILTTHFKAPYILDITSLASGASGLVPNINILIDSGSFTNKIIKLDNDGKIIDYIINDICSSGSGIFLELVCKSLDISIEDMGKIALQSKNKVSITSQCSIFAESEVIYRMNEGNSVEDIAAGCCNSIVGRIIPNVVKMKPKPEILMSGGVAKNIAISTMIQKELDIPLCRIELDPQYIGAFGAAIISLKKIQEGDK
jgi:(R)-2-hydroxyacyl-CoA dehydratese activating ATPase